MENKEDWSNAKDIKKVLMRIKPSPKYDGIGVFAMRDMKKGTVLCAPDKIEEEFFIPWEEADKLDPATREIMNDFCSQDEDGYYTILDLNYLPIPSHMNHHCNGNVGCDEWNNFVTIKDVKAGDELCFDYALVISNPKYRLECKCGDDNCRNVITGNDWKDPVFQKKNYQYMSPLLRELIY